MSSLSKKAISRRDFIKTTSATFAGSMLASPALASAMQTRRKKKVALVGTGIRGITFWGRFLQDEYGDVVEFVGLSDINPGRLAYAKEYIGADCPTFTNFDEMLDKTDIDLLMVTTVDSTHDEFIIKALDKNIDVVTEKPMTTDEIKCQRIIDAERRSEANLIMAFNYRYGKLFTKLKEMLRADEVGDIVSIDFNWYLNTYHGASYFRRWHGLSEKSGTLLLHKSAHHFDLLNWFIGSDPVEVHAYGELEKYGHNNPFRGDYCRVCEHKDKCKFYWDITTNETYMNLYVANENYDGYIRDDCLWREEIDIFDKMAVLIKYANDVQVNYSLTTYSPFEGFRIAFNGKYGHNNPFRGDYCSVCEHKDKCKFYWDITTNETYMNLYVANEKYDGYIRDDCLWREEIDIFDKMAVLIKYANDVQVNYSLTTYSPFEGFRIAFNGKYGRLETHEGIPWRDSAQEDQAELHEKEMDQSSHTKSELQYHEIVSQRNFEDYKRIEFPYVRSGHWGGDRLMANEIFRGETIDPALRHAANTRDGSMAVLIGIAARNSIDEGRTVKIAELTDLEPRVNKWG